ncbi:unnamed protein product [Cylicocyclus nassatus]|uniref:Galectin n=1 Tax=Cylicocyclus nassatus TaxID=53992 RepID=A0AA36M4I4_CYLNA|nr:unnamed protein product [Cylicocyclus nassatus]
MGPTQAIYNSRAPVELRFPSLDPGRRVRIVLIPLPGCSRFVVNLRTYNDIAYHFNPRFDENCVVSNSTQGGNWMNEERANMPFHPDRVYTLEFVPNYGQIQVLLNGSPFTTFNERLPSRDINLVEIDGDIHVHSAHYL